MAPWLTKVFSALSGPMRSTESVRRALRTAQRARLKISLESTAGGRTVVMSTVIEQLREDDMIVSQPSIGGLTHPLAFGEVLNFGFILDSKYYHGMTRCLGRMRIPAGSGNGELFGYRLAMPTSLEAQDRRRAPRVEIPLPAAMPAQLYSPALFLPVMGVLSDISTSGARLRSAAAVGRIIPGQEAFLRAMLPEPVGMIDELIDVVHVSVEARTGLHMVGVSFRRRIEGLSTLIRDLSSPKPRQRVG